MKEAERRWYYKLRSAFFTRYGYQVAAFERVDWEYYYGLELTPVEAIMIALRDEPALTYLAPWRF